MSRIARFVIWICCKFTKDEIQQIVAGLLDVLEDRNPEVKPKDDFKEKHPNYRNFSVDPLAPFTEPQHVKKEPTPSQDWRDLLASYLDRVRDKINGRVLIKDGIQEST